MNVAIEMDEMKFNALECWRNVVIDQRKKCDDVSKRMMDLQNNDNSTNSDFDMLLNESDEAVADYRSAMLSLGKFVFSNWEFFDIVKKGDADE